MQHATRTSPGFPCDDWYRQLEARVTPNERCEGDLGSLCFKEKAGLQPRTRHSKHLCGISTVVSPTVRLTLTARFLNVARLLPLLGTHLKRCKLTKWLLLPSTSVLFTAPCWAACS